MSMQQPRWVQQPKEHPGREGWEIGVTDVVARPKALNARLNDEDPPPEPEGDHLTRGTILHTWYTQNAPNPECWLRLRLPGTEYYLAGHPDTFDRTTVRDLKTSMMFSVSIEKRQEWREQVALYTKLLRDGEIYSERQGAWVPTSEWWPELSIEEAVVDYWPPFGDIEYGYLELDGGFLDREVRKAWALAKDRVVEMLAGQWTPSRSSASSNGGAHRITVAPGEAAHTLLQQAVDAKKTRDEADATYSTAREKLEQVLEPGETVRLEDGSTATYVEPSTAQKLDMSRARSVLEKEGRTVADFERVVTSKELDEEALVEFLKAQGVSEEDAYREETTRTGYVRVKEGEDDA